MSSRPVNAENFPQMPSKRLLSVSLNLDKSPCCPATSRRCDASVGGGSFESADSRLKGLVMPGHGCFFLEKLHAGIGELEMRYVLQTDRGEHIDVEFHGLMLLTPMGTWLYQQGVFPPPESEYRCTGHHRLAQVPSRLYQFDQSMMMSEVTFLTRFRLQISCYASSHEPVKPWPDLDQWVNEPCLDWLPSDHDPSSHQ